MTFFYPLRNKTAFDIFDKAYKAAMQEAKQSTYGAPQGFIRVRPATGQSR